MDNGLVGNADTYMSAVACCLLILTIMAFWPFPPSPTFPRVSLKEHYDKGDVKILYLYLHHNVWDCSLWMFLPNMNTFLTACWSWSILDVLNTLWSVKEESMMNY